eukprot:TRINITY_DN64049_c0_g1_i1.p1 TRINITY_DN64049_c0_g1~~TRINITY_DN64049_c0_g1_i1.p1  ORF type:complete len:203 (-),score=37.67 TRINITY_DN64049_c0_g1_i1:100-708(-)
MRGSTFDICSSISAKHTVPINHVRQYLSEFQAMDIDMNGSLSMEEFQGAIRDKIGLGPEDEVPESLLVQLFKDANIDSDDRISFEEYVLWANGTMFMEDLVVTTDDEKSLRHMSRELGILIPDVERLKKAYNSFDQNGSGEIDETEFKNVVCSLMNARPEDVSPQKLQRYWREADRDGGGTLDFDEFVEWCVQMGEGAAPMI